ncbi:MAG TPA: glycosyltransferase family 2 protein [Pseudomonas sabulinigri]|uniref:Glycosyltransferase 2-like domain-containing protein n=1 Tax=marine sediment metagenome TaxID=412755 RepID=A0A0F9XKZ9_9ZZZZ|nr:glycosyltransferase family 2 protein [Halopseudomonas sabulinigri]HEC50417.1 glycosyltransferase family 2 protein [Halopseudomonas sabulinigri]
MSISNPLISIIIPCHNYAHTLTETLNSLKSQTLSNWEAIIINDGSSDNTQEVIDTFTQADKRFIGINQEKKGVSAARNAGINVAKGAYLAFLDADDLFTYQKLEAHKKHFDSNSSIDISYSDCRYFHTSKPEELYLSFDLTNKNWMRKTNNSRENIITELVDRNLFVISSPMIKKSSLSENTKFSIDLKFYEDWLFWLDCAGEGLSFHYCDDQKCSTMIRVHEKSTVQNKEKMFSGIPLLRKEIEKTLTSTKIIEKTKKEQLKKRNKKHLKKWCRQKLNTSGINSQTIMEIISATDKLTAYSSIARHIIKKPNYFLKTFFKPK